VAATTILPPIVVGQATSDTVQISFGVFTGLQQVYKVGQAPSLVEKLNRALELIGEAESSRLHGDEATAARLDEQAKTIMSDITSEIPSAQEATQRDAASRTLFLVVLIPVTVIVSTFGFSVALVTWRWYERMKLYEMRIVVGKKEED
jgi:hypothetical protein